MSEHPSFTAPYRVIDNFLPEALALQMRAGIEQHFSDPAHHQPVSHQVWNYWFVPELYTYLRTNPDKVMPRELVDGFMQHLKSWAQQALGMDTHYWPYLSLYVNGCRQEMHNDSKNGRFAYVYSLTKPQRLTTGGETIVFHEGDFFRDNLRKAGAGRSFFDLIPPVFNRLVIFDDRLPHAVKQVEGSMDPVEGRFVMHGHIDETPPRVEGALPADSVLPALAPLVSAFSAIPGYHGPLVLRFTIDAQGRVDSGKVLVDRVAGAQSDRSAWQQQAEQFLQRLRSLQFAASAGGTTVTLPVVFGGALRAAP